MCYAARMPTPIRPRRDFTALEARRLQAAQLFQQGHPPATIVHQFHVSWQTASRWYHTWRRRGRAGLHGAGRAGRKPRLDARARQALTAALLKGPLAWGFATNLWTLERVATLIAALSCAVFVGADLAAAGPTRVESPAPGATR